MNRKALVGGLIALALIVLLLIACGWLGKKVWESETNTNENTPPQTTPTNQNPNAPVNNPDEALRIYLPFGNPSNAASNTANADNFLLVNNAYALSYSNSKGIANWSAWRLRKGDLGKASRQNDFRPDDRLPSEFTRVTPSDYTGSGFDRGHLCPSADRSNSPEANSATFLMSNITPQTPDLNQGPWEKLETYSRTIARREGNLFIIAGGYGNRRERVRSKITIPTNFWKIVVVLPPGADASAISQNSRVIAVDMPNVSGIKEKNWRDYRTTVRQIEQKTGYNFFSNLPQNLQNALETKADTR
jgi:endonuclease G, mitochondrial